MPLLIERRGLFSANSMLIPVRTELVLLQILCLKIHGNPVIEWKSMGKCNARTHAITYSIHKCTHARMVCTHSHIHVKTSHTRTNKNVQTHPHIHKNAQKVNAVTFEDQNANTKYVHI